MDLVDRFFPRDLIKPGARAHYGNPGFFPSSLILLLPIKEALLRFYSSSTTAFPSTFYHSFLLSFFLLVFRLSNRAEGTMMYADLLNILKSA